VLVTLGDTDAAGVIYHAAAFHWHERQFTEWLAGAGVPLEQILASGRGLPVRRADADYVGAARLGDRIAVRLRFTDVDATQFVFQTSWTQQSTGQAVLSVQTTHVACDRSGTDGRFARTQLWPELRDAIARHPVIA
jgi:acyl-CoA thioester hydrolase